MSFHARRLKEVCDQSIQTEGAFLALIRRVLANINTAAFAKIDPAITVQLTIGGADRVRMNTKATRQFAGAGQPLSRAQVAADYAQPNLRDELLAQRNFAAFGKPQAHSARSISHDWERGRPARKSDSSVWLNLRAGRPLESELELLSMDGLSSSLAVLTAMITPAVLISASGTMILSTSTRLGRVVDRVRSLSDRLQELAGGKSSDEFAEERRVMLYDQLDKLTSRSRLLQHALTTFYLAVGIFVATSVAIGVVSFSSGRRFAWIPVVMGLIGAFFLFFGSMLVVSEARL